MLIVWRIIVAIAWLIFNFYISEGDGKTILGKDLTKEEKKYIDILRIYAYFSSLFIAYEITGFEY